jgi:cyclophilin family peptidyl-prolyl cis-trans isomerase
MGRKSNSKATRRSEPAAVTGTSVWRRHWVRFAIAAGALVVIAAVAIPALTSDSTKTTTTTNQQETTMNEVQHVTMQTTKGTITLDLYPDKAPKTVKQITTLIGKGFYDGITFHRVVPGFVVQGGDPTGTGTSGSDLPNIPFEENDLKHDKGVIAMARSMDKNSANSQFYITLEAQPSLDGDYVVFGKVTSGMDVVSQIAQGDKMTKVTLTQ